MLTARAQDTNMSISTMTLRADANTVYEIPEWFKKHNILTKTDLEAAENKLRIVEKASEDVHTVSKRTDESDSYSGLELSRKAYQDVYELAASTLIPTESSNNDKLPVLILRGTDDDSGDLLDGLVKRLAEDLDATFVSLAMYDFEDLGRAYHKQAEDAKVLEANVQDENLVCAELSNDETTDKVQEDASQLDTSQTYEQREHGQRLETILEDTSCDDSKAIPDTSETSSDGGLVYTPCSSEANSELQCEVSQVSAPDASEDTQAGKNASNPIDDTKLLTTNETISNDHENGTEISTTAKNDVDDNVSDVASYCSEPEAPPDVGELKDDYNKLDHKRFTSFATYYFSRDAPFEKKKNAITRPSRNRPAVNAILDATLQKGLDRNSEANGVSTGSVESEDAPRPILVSLRSIFDILENPWTNHIVSTLRDKIDEWRKEKNVAVTLFGSVVADLEFLGPSTKCACRRCHSERDSPTNKETDLRDELFMDGSYVVTLHEASNAHNVAIYESKGSQILKESNIRRLVQAIEGRLLKKDFVSLIGEEDRGHKLLGLEAFQILAKYQPDFEELKSYATMLRGRIFKKDSLEVSDLEDIVQRLVLDHSMTCEYALPDPRVVQTETEKKTTSFEKLIAKVRRNCRGFEKDLLECVVDPEKIDTTYKDVIIDQETKNTLHRLINVSKLKFKQESHRLLQQLKTKGVLFYGPPGTGKTHLSRAIAKNSGANMLAIDGADVTHKWVGDTEKYIKAAFSIARKLHPCVLFMDEVESLLYRRGEDDRSGRRAALTQFLQEIDGLSSQKDAPFLICATNRPDDLDQAFLRRLPNKILFAMPTREEREQIIRLHLDDGDLEAGITIEGLARQTRGYSGSDLHGVCQQAAWAWMNEWIDETVGGITDETKDATDEGETKRDQNSDMSKEEDEEDHDIPTTELKLTKKHIAKALQMARPSVTTDSLRHLEDFARRFNPDQVGRLLNGGVASDAACQSIYL